MLDIELNHNIIYVIYVRIWKINDVEKNYE